MIGGADAAREQLGTVGLMIALERHAGVLRDLAVDGVDAARTARPRCGRSIPGAILVAVGIQVVHLATALFIGAKVARASATYGSLGVAFTVLAWLYILSRIIVASAMLNAARWERRAQRPPHPTGTATPP